ncbi:hypothetical protein E6C27_scaffold19G003250 [Cucumis melo var. makuwa]|uniref:Uncharacterized protein n=1 Tax=Cucumis melo var. makuwa TaxID=1194695 RepID=A0A5A7SJC9_CUCMM|nr:hypothetical protein E6C27_scaffold19G003250 [Cucumis melo var. makuwa]
MKRDKFSDQVFAARVLLSVQQPPSNIVTIRKPPVSFICRFHRASPSIIVLSRVSISNCHQRTSERSQFFSVRRTSAKLSFTNQQPERKQVVRRVHKPSEPHMSPIFCLSRVRVSRVVPCKLCDSAARTDAPSHEPFPLQPSCLLDLLSIQVVF